MLRCHRWLPLAPMPRVGDRSRLRCHELEPRASRSNVGSASFAVACGHRELLWGRALHRHVIPPIGGGAHYAIILRRRVAPLFTTVCWAVHSVSPPHVNAALRKEARLCRRVPRRVEVLRHAADPQHARRSAAHASHGASLPLAGPVQAPMRHRRVGLNLPGLNLRLVNL